MQVFANVLLDHIVFLSASSSPTAFETINSILRFTTMIVSCSLMPDELRSLANSACDDGHGKVYGRPYRLPVGLVVTHRFRDDQLHLAASPHSFTRLPAHVRAPSQLRHSGPGLCRRLEGALDQASEEVLVHQADLLALYHPGLAEGNKEKMQVFANVLLDHIVFLSASSSPTLDQASEEVLVHQADLLDVVGRARERVGV
jgi:hypothetical protein